VVDHHEHRGRAPDAVQAGHPLPRRVGHHRRRSGARQLGRTLGCAVSDDGARCHVGIIKRVDRFGHRPAQARTPRQGRMQVFSSTCVESVVTGHAPAGTIVDARTLSF
jgi:hypothetical protein